MSEQFALFGASVVIDTPAAPAAPADVQLSLFQPNFLAMRTPKRGKKAPAPIVLDPTLHDGTLI